MDVAPEHAGAAIGWSTPASKSRASWRPVTGLLVDATGFFAVALVLAGCAARARRRRRPLGRRPAGTGRCGQQVGGDDRQAKNTDRQAKEQAALE